MSMTTSQLPPIGRTLSRPSPEAGFWALYDGVLTCLLIALAGDMFTRIGFASPLWLLCYAMTLMRIAVVWPAFYAALHRHRALLLYPSVCAASVIWSLDPKATLASAIQVGMTIVCGMFIGWRYSMRKITDFLCWVLLAGMVLSLLHWATGIFPWRVYSDVGGLLGIFQQKNMLGQRGLFCAIAAATLVLLPHSQAGSFTKMAAVAAVLLTSFAILLSKSMTSLVLIPMALGLLLFLCMHRIPRRLLAVGILLCVLVLALAPLAMVVAGTDPFSLVLGATGKDATLTGRTLLWDVAKDRIAEHPFFGIGFTAFWNVPEFANARYMLQQAGASEATRSFHNFVLQILVGTGMLGLAAYFLLLFTAISRLLRVYLRHRSETAACGLVIVFMSIGTSLVGSGLYRQHELMLMATIMFAVAAAEDLRRNRLPPG